MDSLFSEVFLNGVIEIKNYDYANYWESDVTNGMYIISY